MVVFSLPPPATWRRKRREGEKKKGGRWRWDRIGVGLEKKSSKWLADVPCSAHESQGIPLEMKG